MAHSIQPASGTAVDLSNYYTQSEPVSHDLIACPHCLHPAGVYVVSVMTRCVREITLSCNNLACGHQWVACLTAERTLINSEIPNKDVELPVVTPLFPDWANPR